MGLRLEGKRALVTAAAQGIGRAVADAYAREGAEVIAADINIAGLAGAEKLWPLRLDVTDAAAVAVLADGIGPIDVLFNGVGIVHAGSILECDEADWTRAFDINVTSMFRLIKSVLPGMIERGSGSIIATSSVASSIIGVRNRFAYGATKAAVIGMVKAIAADHVAQGIRCNAICPGTIDTPSLRQRIAKQAEHTGQPLADVRAAFEARQAMGRLGSAEEVAALAVHLASDESRFTTGTTAIIDGGWSVE